MPQEGGANPVFASDFWGTVAATSGGCTFACNANEFKNVATSSC